MAQKSKLIFKIIAFGIILFFTRCASQMPPDGGEVDKIPPKIIELFPENGTTNYKDNFFEITFSEYVDKSSVKEAIFISPFLQKKVEYDWSGRTLTVYFNDTLKQNTTYTITIGTDVKDINNANKMAEPFSFAFSTGDKIDKGKISGKIYNADPDGVMIFAYRNNEKEIDPAQQKPDYLSQVGKNGKYTLLGLGDGSYSVFAIRDKLRDLKYQKNEDEFGVQYKRIALDDKVDEINNVDFFLTIEDTIAPKITNVLMKDRNHLIVEFGEAVDSTKIFGSNFFALDTIKNKKVQIKYFYKGDAKRNQFYLAFTDTLEEREDWVLVSNGIPDLKDNLSAVEKTPFSVKNDRDTFAVKLLRTAGDLPGDKVDYEDPKIIMAFNGAIDSAIIKNKLSIQDAKGNKLDFWGSSVKSPSDIPSGEVNRLDDALFRIHLSSTLKQSADYTVKLDLKNYNDVFGNKVDSLFQSKITTSNELDFSGASGSVADNSDSLSAVVVLQSTTQNKIIYKQKVDTKKNFDFTKIIPGKYLLWGFKDRNKNGEYDHGTIKPHSFAEEFNFFPDTLNLRARWPVGNVNIDLRK
ncbi:MAG: Ig-like domain-containing protein [Bacteroidota bacterium]